MNVDIFIPTAGNIEALQQCLDSLKQQTYKQFSIIIVALHDTTSLRTLIASYPSLSIILRIQSGKGLVRAAQDGYEAATGDIFIRIDDDVVTEKLWLEEIVSLFKKNTDIGGVTGPTLTSDEGRNSRDLFLFFEKTKKSHNPVWKMIRHIYLEYIYEGKLYDVGKFLRSGAFTLGSNYESALSLQEPIDVDNLEACNMAIRKKLLDEMGGFDLVFNKGLGEYHEADVAYKIKKKGYRIVFSPKVTLHHCVETTETASKTRPDSYHRIANFIIFYKRHLFKPELGYILRFGMNVAFQNAYYCYKFFTTGDWRQLGAIPGTLYGLFK